MNRAWRLRWANQLAQLSLIVLAACSSDSGKWVGDYVTTNDFESVLGWGADTNTLTKEHAHSGRFAVRTDADHEYGLTFDLPLKQASEHGLKGVTMEAWVYLPSAQANAALVLQIIDPATNELRVVHSEQVDLLAQVKSYKEWTEVQHTFRLPPGLSPDYHLRLFLWRSSSPEPVYLDDLQVKALE